MDEGGPKEWMWIAGAFLLACLTFLGFGGLGLAMEDAHVHMALAEHLFEDGWLSLVRGEPSAAGTSPGWVLLNALGVTFTGSPEGVSAILGVASLGILLHGVHALLAPGCRRSAGAAVVLLAWTGPLLWHAFSGMETVLFLGACVQAIAAFGTGRLRRSGVWTSVAILLRLEGLVFAVLIVLAVAFQARTRHSEPLFRRGAAILVGSVGGAAIALFCIHHAHVGALFPVTGEAKRFLWGIPVHGLAALPWLLERSLDLAGQWGLFWYEGVSSHGLGGVWIVGVVLGVLGLRSAWIRRDAGWALLWGWAVVVHGMYALELPVLEVAGRYQAVHLTLLPIAVAAGWASLEGGGSLGRIVGRVGMAICLGHLALGSIAWAEGRSAQTAHLESVHAQAGEWLAQHNPDCLPIMLGEVGWIARKVWTTDCSPRLVDYYGLVDVATFKASRSGRGLSEATRDGPALFAFSLLGGNFPAVHLQLEWLDAPPADWQAGDRVRVRERRTSREFLLTIGDVRSYRYPADVSFRHPVGQSTAMNPVVVGALQRVID